MLQVAGGILLNLLKGYVVKLATKEFAHYVLFEIAEAITKSTETKEDDKWLEKIKETVES
jgi:hypothetical protein